MKDILVDPLFQGLLAQYHVYIFLTEDCSKDMWKFPTFGAVSQIFYSNMIIFHVLCFFGLLTQLGDSGEFPLKLLVIS